MQNCKFLIKSLVFGVLRINCKHTNIDASSKGYASNQFENKQVLMELVKRESSQSCTKRARSATLMDFVNIDLVYQFSRLLEGFV